MRRTSLLLAAALLACGDRLVGGGYAGEPLAVLAGRMVPTPETQVTGRVRLALAWYPQWLSADGGGDGGAPGVRIVTEEVAAEGTFPVDFRFPIYGPPPREALAPLGEGLTGNGAFGVLLAYRDGNGNGRLDPIPIGGRPADAILASSLLGGPESAFALVYVDAPQPDATGLRPGFNLIRGVNDASAAVVPLDTRVDLSLTAGGPLYDAFVCEAGWLTFLVADVCGLPSGGGEEGPPGFAIDGRIALDGTRLAIELRVTSAEGTYPNADVNVNGRVIPWDAARGAFVLEEDATALVRPGSEVVVTATAASTSIGGVFAMPGEFVVAAPAEWQTLSASAPLEVRWTSAANATSYYAGFEAPPAGMATISEPGALSVTFDASDAGVGAASAFVEARVDPVDGQRFVTTALVRRRSFWFSD